MTTVIQTLKMQKTTLEHSFFLLQGNAYYKKEMVWNGSTGPGQIQQFLLLERNLIIILRRNSFIAAAQ